MDIVLEEGSLAEERGGEDSEEWVSVDECSARLGGQSGLFRCRRMNQSSRVDVANDCSSPDVDSRSVLDPRRGAELPVGVEATEGRDNESSSTSGKGSNHDHRPGGVAQSRVGVREDGVDAKGCDSNHAREAVDEAEGELAGVVRDREEGREYRSLGDDEWNEPVESRLVSWEAMMRSGGCGDERVVGESHGRDEPPGHDAHQNSGDGSSSEDEDAGHDGGLDHCRSRAHKLPCPPSCSSVTTHSPACRRSHRHELLLGRRMRSSWHG